MTEYAHLFNLTGQRALVLGAGSGIGEASALGLAAHGAAVACLDINLQAAEHTAAQLTPSYAAYVDMTSATHIQTAFEEVKQALGGIDIVVCTPSVNVRKPMLDISPEEFDRVVSLNQRGSFFVMQTAGRIMAAQGRGSIILFSSIRSQVVEPGQSVYAGTKAATVQMVRTLAAELGPQGVRVNAIAPGVVETPLTEQIKSDRDWYDAYAKKSALGRWAQPSELVGAVVYLASGASSFVTGSLLVVDGGWLAVDGRFTPPL